MPSSNINNIFKNFCFIRSCMNNEAIKYKFILRGIECLG